jgi:replication-associated recombination protein RarA
MFDKKYAPTQFGDLVFQSDIVRARLEKYVLGRKKGNLLLYGEYGTGKSTTAKIIAETSPINAGAAFAQSADIVNCKRFKTSTTNQMTFDLIETGWQLSDKKHPYAVLDEFDILTKAQEDEARDVMDRYQDKAGFILTTNHLHHIDGAILSRCDVVEMPSLDPQVLLAASQRILSSEGVVIPDKIVLQLASSCNGDWRSLLRELEDVVEDTFAKKVAKQVV